MQCVLWPSVSCPDPTFAVKVLPGFLSWVDLPRSCFEKNFVLRIFIRHGKDRTSSERCLDFAVLVRLTVAQMILSLGIHPPLAVSSRTKWPDADHGPHCARIRNVLKFQNHTTLEKTSRTERNADQAVRGSSISMIIGNDGWIRWRFLIFFIKNIYYDSHKLKNQFFITSEPNNSTSRIRSIVQLREFGEIFDVSECTKIAISW